MSFAAARAAHLIRRAHVSSDVQARRAALMSGAWQNELGARARGGTTVDEAQSIRPSVRSASLASPLPLPLRPTRSPPASTPMLEAGLSHARQGTSQLARSVGGCSDTLCASEVRSAHIQIYFRIFLSLSLVSSFPS